MRVGIGYDIHPFKAGRELILGGVRIEHGRGLAGHSDADALTHAVIDALLGAAGMGDIGKMFPADDPGFEGASSIELLARVVQALHAAGHRVVNVDSTVIAQAPRLAPHLDAMRTNLAAVMGVEPGQVGVKATSPEGIGALGQ
ncbi:MAG TPA: 2-C-methyl-D-erythritol 2,4-cyclodiphosphate synthase, partial [Patescibacteria group bacterium]|nr:2-C-methyl-D-erythritol 2,4-cyclodiphosphate synthase [Patescibacteria group bacterium]